MWKGSLSMALNQAKVLKVWIEPLRLSPQPPSTSACFFFCLFTVPINPITDHLGDLDLITSQRDDSMSGYGK